MTNSRFPLIVVLALTTIAACSDKATAPPAQTAVIDLDGSDQLIPMAVGNRWEYQGSSLRLSWPFDILVLDSIVARDTMNGRVWYHAKSHIGGQQGYLPEAKDGYLTVRNDSLIPGFGRDNRYESNANSLAKEPVMGSSYSEAHADYFWTGFETAITPAGTFENCRVLSDGTNYFWFKQGVGVVRAEKRGNGQTWGELELTSYTVR